MTKWCLRSDLASDMGIWWDISHCIVSAIIHGIIENVCDQAI